MGRERWRAVGLSFSVRGCVSLVERTDQFASSLDGPAPLDDRCSDPVGADLIIGEERRRVSQPHRRAPSRFGQLEHARLEVLNGGQDILGLGATALLRLRSGLQARPDITLASARIDPALKRRHLSGPATRRDERNRPAQQPLPWRG